MWTPNPKSKCWRSTRSFRRSSDDSAAYGACGPTKGRFQNVPAQVVKGSGPGIEHTTSIVRSYVQHFQDFIRRRAAIREVIYDPSGSFQEGIYRR